MLKITEILSADLAGQRTDCCLPDRTYLATFDIMLLGFAIVSGAVAFRASGKVTDYERRINE